MKRSIAIFADAVLFGVLLYCSMVAWVLIAGFVDILFSRSVCFTNVGGVAIALLILGSAVWLYFLRPRKLFRTTPGHSLVMAAEQGGKPRSAFFWYCRMIGILLFAYILTWLISSAVFGGMVKRQQRVLETLGVPRDWRQAFPEYRPADNAAKYLDFGSDTLRAPHLKPVSKWFSTVIATPESIRVLAPEIDRLRAANKRALAAIDSGLACRTLVWQDYRGAAIDTFYRIRLPNFLRLQDLTKLYLLSAATAAYRKDWVAAQASCGKAARLLDLQRQDPTLIGKMIAIVESGIICDGLTMIAKNGRDDSRCYPFVRSICDALPSVSGQVRQGMTAEFSSLNAMLGSMAMSPKTFALMSGRNEGKGAWLLAAAATPVYRIWAGWDMYCALRINEYSVRISAPENNAAIVQSMLQDYGRFKNERLRLPALFTSIGAPSFFSMYSRELEARAKPAAVALYAAMLDFKRTRGSYPGSLAQLVPQYFAQMPVSPVDGKPYDLTKNADTLRISTPGSTGPVPKGTFVLVK